MDIDREMVKAIQEMTALKIAQFLDWRAGAYLYRNDGTAVPTHPDASASGWAEAGLGSAARLIREGKWREEPVGGFE